MVNLNTIELYTKKYFKRLTLKIGNYYDGFQVVSIINKDNKLKIEYIPERYSTKQLSQNINVNHKSFFNDLLKINIEKWKNEYPSKLNTGHEWNLKLFFRQSVIVEKKGNNNFPANFTELINLIKLFLPEFSPDIKIRTTLNETDLTKLHCWHQLAYRFYEVSIGGKAIYGNNSTDRRIDIVIIPGGHKEFRFKYGDEKELFLSLIQRNQHEIEIIEVKTKLNRTVIGQILVGEFMFKKKFNVQKVKKSILYHLGDDALELFCKKKQINLIKY